jgi:DNA sulfur modification protein DndB
MAAGEVRRDFIHSHGIVLQALGVVGNVLLRDGKGQSVKNKIRSLRKIDWSRANSRVWEGRAMIGGRVSKTSQNVVLTSNVIKKHLGLELTPEESRIERLHMESRHVKQ